MLKKPQRESNETPMEKILTFLWVFLWTTNDRLNEMDRNQCNTSICFCFNAIVCVDKSIFFLQLSIEIYSSKRAKKQELN